MEEHYNQSPAIVKNICRKVYNVSENNYILYIYVFYYGILTKKYTVYMQAPKITDAEWS